MCIGEQEEETKYVVSAEKFKSDSYEKVVEVISKKSVE
jgi:hypothetical protein